MRKRQEKGYRFLREVQQRGYNVRKLLALALIIYIVLQQNSSNIVIAEETVYRSLPAGYTQVPVVHMGEAPRGLGYVPGETILGYKEVNGGYEILYIDGRNWSGDGGSVRGPWYTHEIFIAFYDYSNGYQGKFLGHRTISKPNNTSIVTNTRMSFNVPVTMAVSIGYSRYWTSGSWYGDLSYSSKSTITREMINKAPTLTVTNTPQTVGANKTVTLTGTVQDPDNDTLTVSATINGKTKTQSITNTSTDKSYTLTWNSNEISNGTYTNIPVTTNDGIATSTTNYTGTIKVDKTVPVITTSFVQSVL